MKEHDNPSGIFGKFFTIARRVNSYRKEFKNYTSVIYHMVREKYPFVARLRDGTRIKVNTLNELFMIISGMGTSNVVYDEHQHVTKINYRGMEIALFGAENNGDIPGVFFAEDYKFLEPKGEVVLDVGANIGDSAIYFLVNGASRVFAFEPYEFSYKILVKNVEASGFREKVEAIKAGVSTKDSSVSIPRG
jgi:tRNA G37 N-methylase Trm5